MCNLESPMLELDSAVGAKANLATQASATRVPAVGCRAINRISHRLGWAPGDHLE
jgi:hypothetical protein